MVRLSDETIAAFDETELSGSVCLGTPDDYADRFLPEILARFARSNPRVEVSVICEPSLTLMEMSRNGEIDLAIVTNCGEVPAEVVRQEPLLWVGSNAHCTEQEEVLPLALSKPPCIWRAAALDGLASVGRKYRVLYTSGNSTAISAAVLAGLAVTVLAELALRPGMRVLGEAEGFPRLPTCEIGIIRSWHRPASRDRRQARRAHRLLARQPLGRRRSPPDAGFAAAAIRMRTGLSRERSRPRNSLCPAMPIAKPAATAPMRFRCRELPPADGPR